MADVNFIGTGTPVIMPPDQDPEVVYGAPNAILNNATAPIDIEFDGVGEPVADGNSAGNPQRFDNKGINVTNGSRGYISTNATAPGKSDQLGRFDTSDFDNTGKNVELAPDAGPPVGNGTERKFFSNPINVG